MFYADPSLKECFVLFLYKNFRANNPACCHVGLGVNATHSVKVLRKNGVKADLTGIWVPKDVDEALARYPECTHCVIQAPWIPIADLVPILRRNPRVHFVVRVHSQVAFLQADRAGIANIRAMLDAQGSELNLTLSCNNTRLIEFLQLAYGSRVLYLPNLYSVTDAQPPTWRNPATKDVLRIGSFGALRIPKNHVTAAAAALMIARTLGTRLEFWISTEREPGGQGIEMAIQGLYDGLKWATVVRNPWQDWTGFRQTIATMDLCVQLSSTETFNITTADAASQYVPSVVGDAIEWVPRNWHADIDDAEAAAQVGVWLLSYQYAGRDGRRALTQYNDVATGLWLDYLASNPS